MIYKNLKEACLKQVDDVLDLYSQLKSRSKYDDLSDLSKIESNKFITLTLATIDRIVGNRSIYFSQAESFLKKYGSDNTYNIPMLSGILEALKNDLTKDYLSNISELIHAELFSDFLEMAEYLLHEGYKDASAVIAGSSLEVHLRQLCNKHDIPIEQETDKGIRTKRADELNISLAKKDIYSKLDQKNITAWLGLRNNAAHGKYNEYSKEQVSLLISSIREFLNRV